MVDDLSAPLSRKQQRKAKRQPGSGALKRGLPLARSIFVVLAIIGLGVAARLFMVDDPEGGRPSAEVAITSTQNANTLANEVAGPVTITPDPETLVTTTTTPGGSSIITLNTIPDGEPVTQMAALPADGDGLFPDLAEETKDGPIPRIGGDGQTPFSAYAPASLTPVTAEGKKLIAIIVTGLGLNEASTLDAVDQLPGDVTLAFAPYGKGLDRTVASARAAGHEIFLEVPLEPFDYPENDPGPQTLLTGQEPRANIDKLFWLMARFGGYVGLINHMGARFTASAADFSPVMEEISARGLGYLDDGSSNRSVAAQLAATNKVPFRRADLMLDTNPAREPILEQLKALEGKAAASGFAIGVISGLPVSIATVAEWAKGLKDDGFVLVPASALMQ
jgi:uncharacterized protein